MPSQTMEKPAYLKIVLHFLVSCVIGVFFLTLVLKEINTVNFHELLESAHMSWCLYAISFYSIAILLRALRWQFILDSCKKIGYLQALKSLIVGYAVNNLIPARLGELYRANYCKQHYQYTRSETLGCIFVERFFDGITILMIFAIGLYCYHFDAINNHIIHTLFVGGAILFVMLLFILLFFNKLYHIFPFHIPNKIHEKLLNFSAGLAIIKTKKVFGLISYSGIIWVFDGLAIWAVLSFAGINLTPLLLCIAIGVISLSTLLPSPPGFIGTMQYAYYLVISPLGYSASAAIIAASASQILLIGLVTLSGALILAVDTIKRYRQPIILKGTSG